MDDRVYRIKCIVTLWFRSSIPSSGRFWMFAIRRQSQIVITSSQFEKRRIHAYWTLTGNINSIVNESLATITLLCGAPSSGWSRLSAIGPIDHPKIANNFQTVWVRRYNLYVEHYSTGIGELNWDFAFGLAASLTCGRNRISAKIKFTFLKFCRCIINLIINKVYWITSRRTIRLQDEKKTETEEYGIPLDSELNVESNGKH
jgi:hypothetical protein